MTNNQPIPDKGNVEKTVNDMGEQAALDIVAELVSDQPAPPAEDKSNVENKEITPKPGEGEEPKPGEGENPNNPTNTEGLNKEKPFAKIGTQEFKTPEELIEFTESQNGFNRYVVGALKKVHPDWFDESGKLDFKKMKPVESKPEETPSNEPSGFTEEQKTALRKAGVMFKEDLEDHLTRSQQKTKADEALAKFEEAHPKLKELNLYTELAELIDATKDLPDDLKLDINGAWDKVKQRHNIVEANAEDPSNKDNKPTMDKSAPPAPTRSSGLTPAKVETDFFDKVISTEGVG